MATNGNPYKALPSTSYWRKAVSSVAPFEVDPVASSSFRISATDKVATAGSCFAQHVSRALQASQMNYYVPEAGDGALDDAERRRRNYGVFSARFGNIYTTGQLDNLLARAFEGAQADEHIWVTPKGRFVDAFRPLVEPDGFETREELLEDRRSHLAHVRTMFEELDVLVFTLGLTEAWRCKRTGYFYPLAPGVAGSPQEGEECEFVNLSVAQCNRHLTSAFRRIRQINPDCKILLTVSPVSLIATFTQNHVLTATTYSKSVLRVVAETMSNEFGGCDYFPSYEIITGSFSQGRYYESDGRDVRPEGVAHVMRVFKRHYVDDRTEVAAKNVEHDGVAFERDFRAGAAIVCDEEAIVR